MTSLDGYSLNEKMDKEFKEIKKQIEVLKFRIEAEMKDINKRFSELTMAAKKKPGKTRAKAEA